MTKKEIAKILVDSPAWDGLKDVNALCRNYSKAELQDAYSMLEEAEEDYYNDIYN